MSERIPFFEDVVLSRKDALLVVDMQLDFMPGGALAVPGGDRIVSGINLLAKRFHTAVYTKDWHPPGHRSFASSHVGKRPMDPIEAPGLGPVLWPDHCVGGSRGAEFHPDLDLRPATLILHKGTNPDVDSYSAFLENDRKTETGLAGYLKDRGIDRVFVCGLAMDYCDFFTAMDGRGKGFQVGFLLDLATPLDIPPGNKEKSIRAMEEAGVLFFLADRSRALFHEWYGDVRFGA